MEGIPEEGLEEMATPSAKISVAFDKPNANVGDTIVLTVTITNDGKANLTNILVLAPLPDGLQYLSHATLTDKAIYAGGIWDVGNLKTTSKLNGTKYSLYNMLKCCLLQRVKI